MTKIESIGTTTTVGKGLHVPTFQPCHNACLTVTLFLKSGLVLYSKESKEHEVRASFVNQEKDYRPN